VILAGAAPKWLRQAELELGTQGTADFDANDGASLTRFLQDRPTLAGVAFRDRSESFKRP
jgi:hypothetical protein